MENILKRPLHHRLRYRQGNEHLNHGPVIPTPQEWLARWEQAGIDMQNIVEPEMHWQDLEVLAYFSKYGFRRFWMEDIWDVDWEAMRLRARDQGVQDVPQTCINPPPYGLSVIRCIIRNFASAFRKTRYLFKR